MYSCSCIKGFIGNPSTILNCFCFRTECLSLALFHVCQGTSSCVPENCSLCRRDGSAGGSVCGQPCNARQLPRTGRPCGLKDSLRATKQMHLKTTLWSRLTPERIAIIKKLNNNKCCRGKRNQPFYAVGGNSVAISQKAKTRNSINPATLLLGAFLKKLKTSYHSDPCTPMFTAT